MKVLNLVRALLPALLLVATGASAQGAYPEAGKTIRFVVGFPPGSTIDNVTRIIVDQVRAQSGAAIVVENRPGALGVIGVETVSRAAPDGYTLMPSSGATHSSGPHLSKAAQRFDAVDGFTHVARLVRFDIVVVAQTGRFGRTDELITAGRAQPKSIAYGYGSGTGQVSGAAFARAANIEVTPISYKGQPQALTDLMSGQVQYVASDLGAVMALVRGGRLTPLMLLSNKRSTILPEVPTAREVGLPSLDLASWIGVAGPAGMPAAVVDWWQSQIQSALARPEVQERLRGIGMEPDALTGEALRPFVREQLGAWGKQIRDAGIQPE